MSERREPRFTMDPRTGRLLEMGYAVSRGRPLLSSAKRRCCFSSKAAAGLSGAVHQPELGEKGDLVVVGVVRGDLSVTHPGEVSEAQID